MEPIEFDAIWNPDGAWTQIAHLTIYKNGVFYCTGVTGFTKTNSMAAFMTR
ncbi:MAG: hypothetical protein KAS74_05155 [Methanosarcinales archaeon]|nr:hypothetical protein [Methanosarcinales archaeon]